MFFNLLFILVPLICGYLVTIKSKRKLAFISNLTTRLVLIILMLMGLSLSALDNLAENLNQILSLTLTFFCCITFFNLTSLALLDKILKTEQSTQHRYSVPLSVMIYESLKLVLLVAAGLAIGLIFSPPTYWVNDTSSAILLLLLFLVGVQLRNSGMTLRQVLLNKKGISIALMVAATSLLGGAIAASWLDLPLNYGLAMASGFGWYSLSGILIGDALGPVYGGASFLLELSRELVALMLIPAIIHRVPLTAIGYGGATSMDFALPIIQTSGGVQCVPIALVSGFILSLFVPVFILLFTS